MENENTVALPRLHGVYRIEPVPASREEIGRRAVSSIPGVTYIPLWESPSFRVMEVRDISGEARFVAEMPASAQRMLNGYDRDGSIPTGACNLIKLALAIQKEHMPPEKEEEQRIRCTCNACRI